MLNLGILAETKLQAARPDIIRTAFREHKLYYAQLRHMLFDVIPRPHIALVAINPKTVTTGPVNNA